MKYRRWYMAGNSLRIRLTISVFIMTLPLVGMLIYNNFYAIDVVRGQVSDSYKNSLSLYMHQIDADLNNVDAYLSTLANGYDLLALSQAQDDDEFYKARIYLVNKLSDDTALFGSISSFFVFEEKRQDFTDVPTAMNLSYEERKSVERFMIELIHSGRIPNSINEKRWQHCRIGQENYLVEIVHAGDAYLGAWVKTDSLLTPLRSMNLGDEGEVLFTNARGEPTSNSSLMQSGRIDLSRSLNEFDVAGAKKKYLVVDAGSAKGDFFLVALIPDHHILANLPYLQRLVWIMTIAALIFIPVGLYFLRRAFLIPLNRVLRAMKKVRDGDWSVRVNLSRTSDEFKLLGDSFDSMMTEIETLRVNVFEEQLYKQKEELQRLQLQVNPHFFLNALNIVFNLAKVKNFELIQEMTLSLIHYFRFQFRSNTSFVRLEDELEHTRNYLKIQRLRFPGQLTWSIDAPIYLTEVPVPPHIVQSFVENSIKHAVTMDKPVHIAVVIELEERDSRMMRFRVQDTGRGFDKQVLTELQAGRSVENERGEHIGIWNVQRRLKLLYQDAAAIRYYNDEQSGGAVVEIMLPTEPGSGG